VRNRGGRDTRSSTSRHTATAHTSESYAAMA
jgi:hypothetical protein